MKKLLFLMALLIASPVLAAEPFNSYTNTTPNDSDELAGYRSGTGMLNYTATNFATYVINEVATSSVVFNTLSLTANSNQIVLDSDGTFTGTLTHSTLGANRTWTLPDATGNLMTVSGSATLSNKFLDTTNRFSTSLTAASSNDFTAFEVGYVDSSGQVVETDASASATSAGMLVLASTTISALNSGTFYILGFMTTSGLTPGATYYLSETAGALTTTKPTAPGTVARVAGYAVSSTVFFFNPDQTYVEN